VLLIPTACFKEYQTRIRARLQLFCFITCVIQRSHNMARNFAGHVFLAHVALCSHPLNPQGRSQHASGAWDSRTILSHCDHRFHVTSRRHATKNHYRHCVTMNCHRRCCVIPIAMEANSFGRCAMEVSSYDHSAMKAACTAVHCELQACAAEAANNVSRCRDCRYRDCCCCWARAASRWAGAVPAEACCRPD
jgi:hypothetical protein